MITKQTLLEAFRQKLRMKAKPVKYPNGGQISDTVEFDIRQVQRIISAVLNQLHDDHGQPVYMDTINDKDTLSSYNGLDGMGKIAQWWGIDEDQNYIEVFTTIVDLTQGETLVYISITEV